MPTDPALPGQMLLDELSRKAEPYGRSNSRSISREHLASLIRAARLVPVLMAERRAWLKHCLDKFFDKDNHPMDFHLSVESMRELRAAMSATDAALARAGVKMGGTR